MKRNSAGKRGFANENERNARCHLRHPLPPHSTIQNKSTRSWYLLKTFLWIHFDGCCFELHDLIFNDEFDLHFCCVFLTPQQKVKCLNHASRADPCTKSCHISAPQGCVRHRRACTVMACGRRAPLSGIQFGGTQPPPVCRCRTALRRTPWATHVPRHGATVTSE